MLSGMEIQPIKDTKETRKQPQTQRFPPYTQIYSRLNVISTCIADINEQHAAGDNQNFADHPNDTRSTVQRGPPYVLLSCISNLVKFSSILIEIILIATCNISVKIC